MNAEQIQEKFYAGYAKAARIIGTSYQHYRPTSASNPISEDTQLANIMVSLNADDPTYSRPNVYGKATWYAIMDGRLLQVGDYIKGIEGTQFIAALQQLLPIFLVDCNRILTVSRPTQEGGVGQVGYGGNTAENEVPIMTAWPGSILQGTKGEKNPTGLPADVRTPWYSILLPAWPGVILRTSDIITDDIGKRYAISSTELTDLGWRLTAIQAMV